MELCKYLGIEPVIFESSLPRLVKHPWFMLRSMTAVMLSHPKVLIVQNPSILLTLLMCLFKRIGGYCLVVDAHNGGVIPDHTIGARIKWLYVYCQKKADLTIVTNIFLAKVVRENNGTPFVLPDKLPAKRDSVGFYEVKGKVNILCVATFDSDEPYLEIFEAAKLLKDDIVIYVTGNYQKIAPNIVSSCPDTIMFTGFLSDEDYWALMAKVDLVMDLTYRENCLVCGAYEAVSLAKPLLLSDTVVLREYFGEGAVFTANKAPYIYEAIMETIGRLNVLQKESRAHRKTIVEQWQQQGKQLVELLRFCGNDEGS